MPAALVATSEKGKGEKLEEEIGDILYELDPRIIVERVLPDTVVVHSYLEPRLLYRRLLQWPPAYAARVVPIDIHIPGPHVEWVVSILSARILSRCLVGRRVYVEARIRGSSRLSKHLQRVASNALRLLGAKTSRRDAEMLVLVECIPGRVCGLSLLKPGCDKVRLWWEERGITTQCSSFNSCDVQSY